MQESVHQRQVGDVVKCNAKQEHEAVIHWHCSQAKGSNKRAQFASAAGQREPRQAVHLEMTNMEVERVLVTNCVLAWAESCWNKKNEEGMQRLWKFIMVRKVCWKTCRGQDVSVRLQFEDFGVNWPRYDTILSPDNRNMNLKETCPDDVENMTFIWSNEKIWREWAERRIQRVKDRITGRANQRGVDNQQHTHMYV